MLQTMHIDEYMSKISDDDINFICQAPFVTTIDRPLEREASRVLRHIGRAHVWT